MSSKKPSDEKKEHLLIMAIILAFLLWTNPALIFFLITVDLIYQLLKDLF